MTDEHARWLLDVTRGKTLTASQWQVILANVTGELSAYLGVRLELDPEPEVFDDGFSMWVFLDEPRDHALQTWSGVLSGHVAAEGEFLIDLAQFVFVRATRERVEHSAGSTFVHSLLVREGQTPRWEQLGWHEDEYGEWEDVPFPEPD
jgi:hypothetical protein